MIQRRIALGALLGAAVLPALYLGVRAFRAEWQGFHPPHGKLSLELSELALREVKAVEFPSADGSTLRGWYQPSHNRAAVILVHGSSGSRTDVVPEMKLLAAVGFGVLAFDLPGHGLSTGKVEWGASERRALGAAMTFVAAQPDADNARIGALGSSLGGYVLLQAAASDQRFRAVAVAGTPCDAREHTNWEYRRFGFLTRWPALLAIRLGGMDIDAQIPKGLVEKVSPRALLVIHGSEDHLVPTHLIRPLYDNAREPKTWFVAQGAKHGNYAEATPEYTQQLVHFFTQHLLGPAPQR